MDVQMNLSAKQLASLKKGRKIRISKKHLMGGGVNLVVHPETFNRLTHCVEHNKGMDFTMSPSELHATMSGGAVNRLNKANRWTDYLGSTYKSVGQAIKPFAQPITQAVSQGVVHQIDMQLNPTGEYIDQAGDASEILKPFMQQTPAPAPSYTSPSSDGQNLNFTAAANAQAVQYNAYQPFAPPPLPPAPTLGYVPATIPAPTSTRHTLPSIETPTSSNIVRRGGYLPGRGAIDHIGAAFSRGHPARFSSYNESFLQQLPLVYKDAARLYGSGLEL